MKSQVSYSRYKPKKAKTSSKRLSCSKLRPSLKSRSAPPVKIDTKPKEERKIRTGLFQKKTKSEIMEDLNFAKDIVLFSKGLNGMK